MTPDQIVQHALLILDARMRAAPTLSSPEAVWSSGSGAQMCAVSPRSRASSARVQAISSTVAKFAAPAAFLLVQMFAGLRHCTGAHYYVASNKTNLARDDVLSFFREATPALVRMRRDLGMLLHTLREFGSGRGKFRR